MTCKERKAKAWIEGGRKAEGDGGEQSKFGSPKMRGRKSWLLSSTVALCGTN